MNINLTQIAVVATAIGITIYTMLLIRRRCVRGLSTQLLYALGLLFCTFAVAVYLSQNPPVATAASQFFWIRVVTSYTGPIPVLLLLIAASYPGDKIMLPKWVTAFFVAVGTLVCLVTYTPLVYSSLRYTQGIVDPKPELGAILTLGVFFIGTLALSIAVAVRGFLRAELVEKSQRFYLVVGLIVGSCLTVIATVIPNLVLESTSTVYLSPLTFSSIFVALSMGFPMGKQK